MVLGPSLISDNSFSGNCIQENRRISTMKKVLIIENEKRLARFIELELQYEGFEVTVIYEGKTGLCNTIKEEWDVILLGLVFPALQENEIYKQIREITTAPIIMLTERKKWFNPVGETESRMEIFIPRPFVIEDLLAGIRLLSGFSTS
jgi:DNA-binding response OmpR family regulator